MALSWLAIAGIIIIIIGIIMTIIGIILLIVENAGTISWYVWLLVIGGILMAIIGGVILAVALSEEASPRRCMPQPTCGQIHHDPRHSPNDPHHHPHNDFSHNQSVYDHHHHGQRPTCPVTPQPTCSFINPVTPQPTCPFTPSIAPTITPTVTPINSTILPTTVTPINSNMMFNPNITTSKPNVPIPIYSQKVVQLGNETFNPDPIISVVDTPGQTVRRTVRGPYGDNGEDTEVSGIHKTPGLRKYITKDIPEHEVVSDLSNF